MFVRWQPRVFPFAVALSVLVFLALTISVVWPGEGKPLKKCLLIFGWLAAFIAIEQGLTYLVHIVINNTGNARDAMLAVLPPLGLLVALLLLRPFWRPSHRTICALAISLAAIACTAVFVKAIAANIPIRIDEFVPEPEVVSV